MKMFLGCYLCVFALFSPVTSFSHGAPEYTCKDPSTFHTRTLNLTHEGIIMPHTMLTNPYIVASDVSTYGPGERIVVTLQSSNAHQPLRGFFLQAIQAGIHLRDLRRRAFGRFENTTANERPSACQSVGATNTTGITHSNNKIRMSIDVIWVAPVEYNPGDIQFLATGVLDYNTYWTDIRSPRLVHQGYTVLSENNVSGRFTPTAAWFRWLQYLRQQQLLKQNLGVPTTKGEGPDQKKAGHGHHHHNHAHDHVQSVTRLSETTTEKYDVVRSATNDKQNVTENHQSHGP